MTKNRPPEAVFMAGFLLGLLLAGGSITASEFVSVSSAVAPCPESGSLDEAPME